MKILFLAPQPFFLERGTPIAVRMAVETLARLGHRVDLLVEREGEFEGKMLSSVIAQRR